jgi:mannose-1-phosphate guanylyltransferase
MTEHRYCVIMADGTGSPSQLRITFERFKDIVPSRHILVVTLARFAESARAILPELPAENLLLEPSARKTAPCMVYAAYTLLRRDPEAVIVATPWDLVIRDEQLFGQTVNDAFTYVEEHDVLMTLGIVPRTPDVNFGYIQVKEGRNAHLMAGPLQVKTFTEKPSQELAEVFVRTGEFFWNSGIFVWKASTICSEMERYVPEVTELFRGWQEHICEPAFVERAYAECPKVSLDYGVMEHTDRAWLYPARFGWADIERL